MRDIAIGSPQFDTEFVIDADDESAVIELLTPQVQSAIFGLDRFAAGEALGRRCVRIQIGRGSAVVIFPWMLSDCAALAEFVRLGIEFSNTIPAAFRSGITFCSETSTAIGNCMVCGEVLAHDIVLCRRCQTPHHRECWGYYGGCSTYGCREKSFVETPPIPKAG